MKRIYTLMTLIACTTIFAANTNAQITQNFESQAEVTQLAAECWSISDIAFSSSSPIIGAGSIVNGGGGAFTLITPYLTTNGTVNISFSYQIVSVGNGSKIFIDAIDNSGVSTEIGRVNLQGNNSGVVVYDQNLNIASGSRRISIRTTGNVNLKVDNLTIGASYTHPGGCTPEPILLPVKLNSFAGNLNNNMVNLNWSVSDNETGHSFEVEKSTDGAKFLHAATVLNTTSYGMEEYAINLQADAAPVNYFRLKVVNKDGSISYSKVLSFRTQANGNATLKMLQNPIINQLAFNYKAENAGQYQVNLYAATGLKVMAQQVNMQKGTNLISFDVVSSLPKGIYVLELSHGSERTTVKIVK